MSLHEVFEAHLSGESGVLKWFRNVAFVSEDYHTDRQIMGMWEIELLAKVV